MSYLVHLWSDRHLVLSIPTLVREAIDPVVNPNAQSMHMHRVLVSIARFFLQDRDLIAYITSGWE